MAAPLASILPNGMNQFLDGQGNPLAGGSVWTFVPNTTTLKTTWQDSQEVTPNSNPIILNAAGECLIYGSGQYTQAVYNQYGDLQWTALTSDLLSYFSLPATTRIALSAPANYYVATTGSDSNNGTQSSPWLTIQHAINYVQNFIDTQGNSVTINVADGTYTGGAQATGQLVGNGQFKLVGNIATPANCIISTTDVSCVDAQYNATLYVSGFLVETVGTAGDGVHANDGARIFINGAMNYGACVGTQINATALAAIINFSSDYVISGGSGNHYYADNHGLIYEGPIAITLTGTPAFSFSFADAANCGLIETGATFSGSATTVDGPYSLTNLSGLTSTNPLPGVGGTSALYLASFYNDHGAAFGVLNSQTFYLAGTYTYTPTPGMLYCQVYVVGGGGGGGGGRGGTGGSGVGGGGASGGIAIGIFSASAIGSSQVVTIGAAGAGGAGGATGSGGGTSSLGSLISATGGGGGSFTSVDNSAIASFTPGSGGPGTGIFTGGTTLTGNYGNYGSCFSNSCAAGGIGAPGFLSNGGGYGASALSAAVQNGGPGDLGSGGGGGISVNSGGNGTGGTGGPGVVVIYEYIG